jgi:hypothetical protein
VETVLVLGLAGVLAGFAGLAPGGGSALTAVQGELRASVEQDLLLARALGRPVRAAPGGKGQEGAREGAQERAHESVWSGDDGLPALAVPLTLPKGVRWGLPDPAVPLPAGMAGTLRAHRTGAAHPADVLAPGGSAEAGTWFLTDGRDAVCLRLSGRGRITLLRWRRRTGRWERT